MKVTALFVFYSMLRALRIPRLPYPPARPNASTLAKELMCPKCGSRELKPTGCYTLRCKNCGFTFSIGAPLAYPYYASWWFLSALWWWPLIGFCPVIWLKRDE